MNNSLLLKITDNLKKQIIIMTDLEPDDLIAIDMLYKYMLKHAVTTKYLFQDPIFIVGEGNSTMKVLRTQTYYNYNCIDKVIIKEGYSSSKNFNYDGHDIDLYVDENNVIKNKQNNVAIDHYKTGKNILNNEDKLKNIDDILSKHSDSVIICLKPPRELMDLYKIKNEYFNKMTLVAYTSFNFRCLFKPIVTSASEPIVTSSDMINFLNSFESTYLYETYHAIGSDNTITGNDVDFKKIPLYIQKVIKLWNLDMITDCESSIKEKINDWDFTDQHVTDYLSTNISTSDAEYVKRNYKVWKSIKDTKSEQFVNADCGLVSMLINDYDNVVKFIHVGNVEYNDVGYSIPKITDEGKINLIMSSNEEEKNECNVIQKQFIKKFYEK